MARRPRALLHHRLVARGRTPSRSTAPDRRDVALAHNGNLINAVELHAELPERGRQVPLHLRLRDHRRAAVHARGRHDRGGDRRRGAAARGRLLHGRDDQGRRVRLPRPAGLRPLALGRLGDRYCVASESCAFDIIGAEFLREVQPGEMVALSERGIETRQVVASRTRKAFCVFEHIYFARPDSILEGNRTQVSRRQMGEILWREAPVEADLVVAVPDSGNPAASGYSTGLRASRSDDGLIKNRYVARTFIQPGQELRKHGLRMKFNPLPEIVGGKRLVVVDDSIVRGNTTRQIVEDAARRRRRRRSTCASPRRRSATPATTASTCPRPQEMIAHGRTVDGDRRPSSAPTRSPTCRSTACTRRSARRARPTATPASPASTRSSAPSRRTASSRSRSSRSSGLSASNAASGGSNARISTARPSLKRQRWPIGRLSVMPLWRPFTSIRTCTATRSPRSSIRSGSKWSSPKASCTRVKNPATSSGPRQTLPSSSQIPAGCISISGSLISSSARTPSRGSLRVVDAPEEGRQVCHGGRVCDFSAPSVKGLSQAARSRRSGRYCGRPHGPDRRPQRVSSASRPSGPGQREAVRGRAGGARRARGDAHRLGQVALLPAAGACCGTTSRSSSRRSSR